MEPVIREIGGRPVEFTKARRSHLDGQDCVHVGSADGMVYLFERDNPGVVPRAAAREGNVFRGGGAQGGFQVGGRPGGPPPAAVRRRLSKPVGGGPTVVV